VTNGSGQLRAVQFVEEGPAEEKHGRGWRPWLWGLLVLALVVAAAAAAYFLSRPKQVVVPGVTDEQFNIARTRLQNAGFGVKRLRVPNAKPPGIVFAESPSGGSKADKGSTVTVTVSSGRGKVSVPSVQGETVAHARASLKRAGLSVDRTIPTASSRFPKGQATGTSPGAAKPVPRGTKVALFVSTGPAARAIPDVTGETQGQATADLSNASFKVHSRRQVSTSTSPGHVISQTPVGDKTARPGSTVTIVVAKARPTGTVPPVTGDPQAGAASALRSQGFHVATTTRPVSDPSRAGTVVAQSPPGGSRRPRGSTVTIVIGTATQTTTSSSTTTTKTSSSTTTTKTSSTPTTSTTTTTSTSTTPTNGAVQQGPGTTPTTP
jgi:serine/threonine-protein kinase